MAFKTMPEEHGQQAAVVQVHVGEHYGIDPAPIDLRKRQISLLVFPRTTDHAAVHNDAAASRFNQRA